MYALRTHSCIGRCSVKKNEDTSQQTQQKQWWTLTSDIPSSSLSTCRSFNRRGSRSISLWTVTPFMKPAGKMSLCLLSLQNKNSTADSPLLSLIDPLSPKYQITNSPFVFLYISYRSGGETLLKYQWSLTWVTMFSILMTSLTDN